MPNQADRTYITIGSTRRGYNPADPAAYVDRRSLRIGDRPDGEPDTAAFDCIGFTPTVGQRVRIWLEAEADANLQFAGHVVSVSRTWPTGTTGSLVCSCSCLDYTWLLKAKRVSARYADQSATDIAIAIVGATAYADDMGGLVTPYTTTHVEIGLPTIDEITFVDEPVDAALTKLAQRLGAHWYLDYTKDLHFFVTPEATQPDDLTLATDSLKALSETTDLSQVATRVYCQGGGGAVVTAVGVGGTSVLLDDASRFDPSGGLAQCGELRLAYGGITSNAVSAITGSISGAATTGGSVPDGSYACYVTAVTDRGESVNLCSGSGAVVGGGNNAILWTVVVPSHPRIKSLNLYRHKSTGGAPAMYRVGSLPPLGGICLDTAADAALVQPIPTTSTADGGAGTLTDVTGVSRAIAVGEAVRYVAQADDATAQAALQALFGMDGVVVDVVQGGDLSYAEIQEMAAARLALLKDAEVTLRYKSEDQKTRAGCTVTADLDAPVSIAGDYLIQSVDVAEFSAHPDLFPAKTATASNRRYTFEELLRRIGGVS